MNSRSIKIQEWRMPTITEKDQRMIDRGYREFFARRGVKVAEGFRHMISGAARNGRKAKEERGGDE